jgi:uncharacterized membrane protein (Fun14 family)
MDIGKITSIGVTITGGFFVGVLIGYAIKKVIKVAAVIVGLFLTALVYLQYQQILNINWVKVQSVSVSHNAVATLASAASEIHGIGGTDYTMATAALSDIGIPLTGSTSMGFAVGFMKG